MHCESMDAQFWGNFAKNIWEKESFCSDKIFKSLPITDSGLFGALIKEIEESQLKSIPTHLYIDGRSQRFTPENEFYPNRTDRCFEGYHNRLTKEMNIKEYCLVLHQFHIVDFELWEWCKEFLTGLYREMGFNKLGNTTALFIGNYTSTPFGIHVDPQSAFQIPVVGKKTIRAWTADYKKQHPTLAGAKSYDAFLDGSIKIEAQPGGLLYWPSHYWHIGEKTDDFNISIALGLGCTKQLMKPLFDLIVDAVMRREELTTDIIVPMNIDDSNAAANSLPADLSIASDFISEVFSQSALHQMWIKLVTGSNYLHPPQPLPISTHDKTLILNSKNYPIVCVKLEDKLAISANGHLVEFNYNEQLVEMISTINHSTTIDIKSIIETYHTITRDNITYVINWLESIRAITTQ